MIFMLVGAAVVFALMFPETETGRFAKRHFVDAPARWLNNLSPLRVAAVVAGFLFLISLSVAFPPDMIVFVAGDLTAYFEIMAALVLVVTRVRYREFASAVTATARQIGRVIRRHAGRGVRTIRPAISLRKPPLDDEDPAWVFVA